MGEDYIDQLLSGGAPAPLPPDTSWIDKLLAEHPEWIVSPVQGISASAETGEAPGPIEGYTFYDPKKSQIGDKYYQFSPSGKFEGERQIKKPGNFLQLVKEAALDTAPIWMTMIGMPGAGNVGALLGKTIATQLGFTGLSTAAYSAIGSAAGQALLGTAQGKPFEHVLKNVVAAGAAQYVPGEVASIAGDYISTGNSAVDRALDAAVMSGTKAAITGESVSKELANTLDTLSPVIAYLKN